MREGLPVTITRSAWEGFTSAPSARSSDLNERLFDLSSQGRVEHWRVALDDFREEPVLGQGAGTFVYSWQADRKTPSVVHDAHSLYLETLGELGLVGLLLIVGTLAIPLVAAFRGRRDVAFVGAFGAYAAWLAHAGVDWDWELPGVSAVAGLIGSERSSVPLVRRRFGEQRSRVCWGCGWLRSSPSSGMFPWRRAGMRSTPDHGISPRRRRAPRNVGLPGRRSRCACSARRSSVPAG